MKWFSTYLYQRTSIILALIATGLMVLYASRILGSESNIITSELQDGDKLLGLKLGYGIDYVSHLFSYLSQIALKQYSSLLIKWDNLFPFVYGSMYLLWLSLIYKNITFKKPVLKLINLYPLIPLIADLIENYFERLLITNYLDKGIIQESTVMVASGITTMKWGLSTLNYIIIVIGIILLIKTKIKAKT